MTQWGNRLQTFDGFAMTYDEDGNLLRKTSGGFDQLFFWNSLGQLDSVVTNGTAVRFGYDGRGRRVRKATNLATAQFIYDGNDLFAELNGSGSIVAEYNYYPGIDQPHSMRRNGAYYYYATDYPGNVVGLIDASGSLVNEYRYGPFGGAEHVHESVVNPLRFGARERDAETGLYYQRARYYDPDVGRFISEDPIGLEGGINAYAYTGNDPINRRDPTGREWECTTQVEMIDTEDGPKEIERTVCKRSGGGGGLSLEEAIAFGLGFAAGTRLAPAMGRSAGRWLLAKAPRLARMLGIAPAAEALIRNGVFERIFQTAQGNLHVYADALSLGRVLHLRDILVYPANAATANMGMRGVLAAREQLFRLVRDSGFDVLIITGHRTGSGKLVEHIFHLR